MNMQILKSLRHNLVFLPLQFTGISAAKITKKLATILPSIECIPQDRLAKPFSWKYSKSAQEYSVLNYYIVISSKDLKPAVVIEIQ